MVQIRQQIASALDPQRCHQRRCQVAVKMHNGVAVVFAANEPANHKTSYCQAPNLRYLTGCLEPNSALVLIVRQGKITEEIIYCRQRDRHTEIWNGKMLGPTRAKRMLGIDQAKAWTSQDEILASALVGQQDVFVDLGCSTTAVSKSLATLARTGVRQEVHLHDLRGLLGKLRMVKDHTELSSITSACTVTTAAFIQACAVLAAAKNERDIVASLSHSYISAGSSHAFLPIVACGANACVAHYVANRSRLQRGKLLLIDTGCELDGYTSDLTRVVPIAGTFNEAQRELHAVVVAAQGAAMKKVKPSASLLSAQTAASRELARGLIDLGICRGKPAKVVNSTLFAELYFHSIGHMLGLEVHDSFIHDNDDKQPPLRAGMVLTIEPGLYLDDRQAIPPELRNTGIRIEDTLAVTSKGFRNLTEAAPKTARQIESLLSQ